MRPEAPDTRDQISAVLVDDHDLFRGGLKQILEDQGVRVVGEASDGERAVELARDLAPDVTVMDLNMPGIGGVEATRRIADAAPATRVMVLTITPDDGAILDAMIAGASGSIVKDQPIDELAEAIRVTALGGTWLQPRVARRLLVWLDEREQPVNLTERELEALRLVGGADGADHVGVTAALSVPPDVVRELVASVLDKLQAAARAGGGGG
jgi:DNA-binding NarL/FixJ family response regulator